MIMLLGGLVTSAVFYFSILFSKEPIKSKVTWTIIVLFAVVIQINTEQFLIKTSYLIFLKTNKAQLESINQILANKPGGIVIVRDKVMKSSGQWNQSEIDELIDRKRKIGAYMLEKTEGGVYYGLYGMLDVRLGVTYWTSNSNKPDNSRHLEGLWYR